MSLVNSEHCPDDITQHEILALQTRFNLADAHTHQRQSGRQQGIINRLPQLWYEAEETSQGALEKKFIRNFFKLHCQETAIAINRTMLFYAASIAMVAVATLCMQKKWSVSLIDPCFDNLHDILKNYGIPLHPLYEENLYNLDQIEANLEAACVGDVICLVDPNNPTGFSLAKHGREGFEQIIRFCKAHRKTLVIDFCFAAFALFDPRFGRADLYEILESSGISYMAIEDTGKTWPLQDAKCALLTVSQDLYDAMFNICTSILLNVSPFILNLVNEYVVDSAGDNFDSICRVLSANREVAKERLNGSALEYCEPVVDTSVAWFRIKDPRLTASAIQRKAYERQVYVLPGNYFFWSRREMGERYIRIALARDPSLFKNAISRFEESLYELQ